MGRPRPNTNASGHGEPAPNPSGYPAPPYPPPPPPGAHDVAPQPQHETEPPDQYYPPPAPYSHDVGVQQHYHEGAAEETRPAPYPPQEPYASPQAADGADVPHYPPESATAGARPVQYPPQTQPVQYPPPAPYPPPQASPLRAPVMGAPVQFPPPGPQQNKDDGGAAFAYAAGAGEQWSSELFDCDMSQDYAIATAICPCVTFGQIAEIVDEGQTSCLLAGVLYMVMIPALFTCSVLSSGYRQKIRQKYNLVEAPSDDCSVHLINPCCALCQEYRELQSQGFDPSLGWMANLALAQQQQETAMYPPGNQYMSR
ncbi:protein PLANT CADMIUM RESISTANCE 8-like [Iris pallida]|uniref:Protein PLANT CADMIUM RESISTANCE 8-like n=1 Tax=Iris pallida TaxID=29817 RepID=A0AAX6DZJ4_IRIPA|nr:protein PLANT CADMIUM RESISTANCE 8-like [Iris pallida]